MPCRPIIHFTSLHSFSLHSSSLLFTAPPWALLSTHTHSQMGTAIDDLAVTATAHGESQATDLEVSRNPLCSYLLCCALLILSLLYSTLLYSTLLFQQSMNGVCLFGFFISFFTHTPPTTSPDHMLPPHHSISYDIPILVLYRSPLVSTCA